MLGGQLQADQQRRAERGHLRQDFRRGPEGDQEREPPAAATIAQRSGSRPGTWPQMLKGESRSAW